MIRRPPRSTQSRSSAASDVYKRQVSVCVCVAFAVFSDCESCTWPISTNPGSMEASKYGLERRTCSVTHHLEVVAVAGLLWISRCVWGAAGFRFFRVFFIFERTRPAASMRTPCLIYLSTSTGVRTGLHSLVGLSVCLCIVTFVVFTDRESCTTPISTNPRS